MSWCFAIVNNKLAEIFFERKGKKTSIFAHCYVDKTAYKTKEEQKWIAQETKKYKFIWKNKIYKFITKNIVK